MQWCRFHLVSFLLSLCACKCYHSSRVDEGYPMGFMSVCPDVPIPDAISKDHLRHLYFVVQGSGRTRKRYTYWTAKRIAEDPRVNFNRKTMLLAIGYLDSTNFPIARMFANIYEDLNYNVILLDNNKFSTVHYFRASRLMKPVGKHVAEVLVQLTHQGLQPSKLELLGFSLGGHTISFIAKSFQHLTGKNISRITALEPCGPCFRRSGPTERLAASDADFVDVIHTNIDGFGMAAKMGHVDFYINGGEYQPSDLNIYPCTATCSHFRSLFLWESALRNPGSFLGIQCDSIQEARNSKCYDRIPLKTNVMGLDTNRSRPGIYYLATGLFYPYFLKEKGLSNDSVPWIQMDTVGISDV